jgi:hypothetical protein
LLAWTFYCFRHFPFLALQRITVTIGLLTIAKFIKNPTVSSYLQRHQPDFMNEFQSFVVATSFDDVSGASA